MAGETDLDRLIAGMTPHLEGAVHVFATLPPGAAPPDDLNPVMVFREAEGLTLILPQAEAAAAGLRTEFPCRRITLRVHSALEATGFMAAIGARLAAAGIAVNPVSGFFHDHLFVPVDRAADALEILLALQSEAAQKRRPGRRRDMPD